MPVSTVYTESADFTNPGYTYDGIVGGPTSLDMGVFDANGYSGNIIVKPEASTYEAIDTHTNSERYWMGTLWLGGINNPSITQHVTLEIDGSDTDVGIFECVPSSGGAPTEIDFKGTNDSVSMYPGEALG